MSYDPGFFREKLVPVIHELDLVRLGVAVRSDEGRDVPAGSVGTVVGVWAGGSGFEVEFEAPFEALATVRAGEIAEHRPYPD